MSCTCLPPLLSFVRLLQLTVRLCLFPGSIILLLLLGAVHRMMSCQGRYYHRTEHLFDLFTNGTDQPLQALAAIFHDVVGKKKKKKERQRG